jgi:nitronate monooxygenase
MAQDFYKKSLLESEADATTITDAFSGLYARALRNTFARDYADSGAPVLPPLLQRNAAADVFAASAGKHDGSYVPMWSGQGVGLIRDLPGAAEVIEAIVREARATFRNVGARVRFE